MPEGHEKLGSKGKTMKESNKGRGKKSNQKLRENEESGRKKERRMDEIYIFREKQSCKEDKFAIADENGTDI